METLSLLRPDVIVHCTFLQVSVQTTPKLTRMAGAAQRSPDIVSSSPAASLALNDAATRTISYLSHKSSILLIYISTDYVFPGTPGEAPYTSNSTPRPTNEYGSQKLAGEHAVTEETRQGLGLVLRVPVLYGPTEEKSKEGRKESAVNSLVDKCYEASEREVVMDDWAVRYPTNTEDVGRVCADIAQLYLRKGTRDELPRILHFSSEDRMTKYEICQLLATELLHISLDERNGELGTKNGMVANKQGNDPPPATQRPYDCHLDTKELKDLGVDVNTQSFLGWWKWEMRALRK